MLRINVTWQHERVTKDSQLSTSQLELGLYGRFEQQDVLLYLQAIIVVGSQSK